MAREKLLKKRRLQLVNEHFETIFNAAITELGVHINCFLFF